MERDAMDALLEPARQSRIEAVVRKMISLGGRISRMEAAEIVHLSVDRFSHCFTPGDGELLPDRAGADPGAGAGVDVARAVAGCGPEGVDDGVWFFGMESAVAGVPAGDGLHAAEFRRPLSDLTQG